MDASVVITAIGLAVTATASVISYRLGRRSEFAIAEWMRELRSWAEKVIVELSEAIFSVSSECTTQERNLRAKEISGLIEVGRFYLPNQKTDQHGVDKPPGYRGCRHAALDPLVAACRVLLHGAGDEVDESQVMWELRREFVSMIFNILGPEHHNKIIGQMIRESHSSRRNDKTVGGLLPKEGAIPQGASYLLRSTIKRIKAGEGVSKSELPQSKS